MLKALNDKVFGNKKVPDAVQNAFMTALYSGIRATEPLRNAFSHSYSDYKSLRVSGIEADPSRREKIIQAFDQTYRSAIASFAGEFEDSELSLRTVD